MNQTYMKTSKILPLVMSMAVPMVVSMLISALYNIIDSYFIAKISEDAMTAISLIFPLYNIAAAVSIGFGVGANALTAFFLGEGNHKKAEGAASLSLLLAIVHSIVLTVVLLIITKPFLSGFTDSEAIARYGVQYGSIVFGFLFIQQLGLIYEKLFQAVGHVKVSMFAMSAGCITNIVLDPIMIYGLGPCPAMGIHGAAVATIIGQAVMLAWYLVAYGKGLLGLRLSLADGWRSRKLAKRLYGIGIPAILNQALPSLLITVLNTILAQFSQTDILILGVYYKLQTFIYLTANGIVQGIRPIIAYNYGAGMIARVKAIIHTALGIAFFVMSVGTVLCLFIPQQLIGLFSSNAETIQAGATALRIICAGFIVSAISVVVCGTMEALGFGFMSFLISLLRYVIIILPLAWILSHIIGATGVWHSFWIAELGTAMVSMIIYRCVITKIHHENRVAAQNHDDNQDKSDQTQADRIEAS